MVRVDGGILSNVKMSKSLMLYVKITMSMSKCQMLMLEFQIKKNKRANVKCQNYKMPNVKFQNLLDQDNLNIIYNEMQRIGQIYEWLDSLSDLDFLKKNVFKSQINAWHTYRQQLLHVSFFSKLWLKKVILINTEK